MKAFLSALLLLSVLTPTAFAQTLSKLDIASNLPAETIALGDIDGDGILDVVGGSIYSTNPSSSPRQRMVWYKLDVDGNVYDEHTIDTFAANHIEVVDLTNDGLPEVISAVDDFLKVDRNLNCGNFELNFGGYFTPATIRDLKAGDFNGDGYQDMAVLQGGNLWVYINNGTGFFGTTLVVANGLSTIDQIATGDLDGSGTDDITYALNGDVVFLAGNTNNTFSTPNNIDLAPFFAYELIVDFFDNDTIPDVIALDINNSTSSFIQVEYNAGSFTNSTLVTGIPGNSQEFAIADVDTNGFNDILHVQSFDDVVIQLNDGTNNFTGTTAFSNNFSMPSFGNFLTHDFNHDLLPDLINIDGQEIVVQLNSGLPLWNTRRQISTYRRFAETTLAVGDLNGDSLPDLLCGDFENDQTLIYYQDSAGNYLTTEVFLDNDQLLGSVIADIDGDGDNDIIAANSASLSWYEYTGIGFTQHGISTGAGAIFDVSVGDYDGDLDLDVTFKGSQFSQNRIIVMENDGLGNFTTVFAQEIPGTYAFQNNIFADINNDSIMDVVFAGQNHLGYLRGDAALGFDTIIIIADTLSGVSNIDLADLNGDSIPDILVADNFYLLQFNNLGAGTFNDFIFSTLPSTTDWVSAGDVDNDGDDDFFYSNNWNTWYVEQTSPSSFSTFLLDGQEYAETMTLFDGNLDDTLDLYAVSQEEIAMHSINLPTCITTPPCTTFANFLSTSLGNGTHQFTNIGAGFQASFWDFGDGMTSTEADPAHTFATNGTYAVTLTNQEALGGGCSETITLNVVVTSVGIPCNITASFTITDNGNGNFSFTNTSMGTDIVSFWDFGDGNTSTNDSPTHIYNNNGSFTVELMITDTTIAGGTCNMIITDTVVVSGVTPTCAVSASFTTFDNGGGNFFFANDSTGANFVSFWAFGDGTTSNTVSPLHTYLANGTFVVVLTMVDTSIAGGTCFDFAIDTVQVTGVTNPVTCNAAFVSYPDTASNSVTVVNSSFGSNLTYFWDFGDGTTSTQQFPNYSYSTNGPFNLCLTVDDGAGCSSTYCDSIGNNGFVLRNGFDLNVIAPPVSVGLDEMDLSDAITLFPNPATAQITLESSIPFTGLELLDVTGKILGNYTVKTIDVSNLPSGIYFIKVTTDHQTIAKRFVKQ